MRIVFDARKLRDHGIGTYIRGLLPALWRHAGDQAEWMVLVHPHDRDAALLPGPRPRRLQYIVVRAPTYAPAAHWEVGRILQRLQPDVFHMPHFPLPFLARTPAVVTVHDTILLQHWPGDSRWWLPFVARGLMAWTLHRAAAVLTVSHAVADQIARRFPAVRKKLFPIWNGLHPAFREPVPAATHPPPDLPAAPYYLYVGNLKPHKNLHRLIAAWEINLARGWERPLVLAGLPEPARQSMARRLRHHREAGRLFLLPWLEDALLVQVYARARALIHPALAEGFGLTLLEAMAVQVPVACSDIPVHREIAGTAALFFDPRDPVDIARAMRQIDADEALRQRLIEKGRENLRRFSWDQTARAVWDVYRSILTGT